jgi:KDO2-lipid IV(A) lauroyltransferase
VGGRSLRHSLEYGSFRLLRGFWGLLPETLVVRLAALAGTFAGTVLRIRRRDVDAHLERAFPDRSRSWRNRVARASYAHLGREAATLFRLPRWSMERLLERVTFEGLDDVRRAMELGRGVVLLTGHLGNWELAGAALAARGIPLDVVGKGMANRSFEADLFETRERLGMRVIEMTRAPKGVLRALGEGRVVAIVGDQNAHRGGVFVPFFGLDASTARGPALFAIRTGAPTFYGAAVREPGRVGRYLVRLREMPFEPTGDLEMDVQALLTAYLGALEQSVKAAPEQYFWQHKRWKTRPSEEQRSAG